MGRSVCLAPGRATLLGQREVGSVCPTRRVCTHRDFVLSALVMHWIRLSCVGKVSIQVKVAPGRTSFGTLPSHRSWVNLAQLPHRERAELSSAQATGASSMPYKTDPQLFPA